MLPLMPRHKLPPEQKRKHLVQVLCTTAEIMQLDSERAPKQSRGALLRESYFGASGDQRGKPKGGRHAAQREANRNPRSARGRTRSRSRVDHRIGNAEGESC